MTIMYELTNKLLLVVATCFIVTLITLQSVTAVHTATDEDTISEDGAATGPDLTDILPLMTTTVASSILKFVFVLIGAVLYLAHQILYKLDHVDVGDSFNHWLIEMTGACMFATGVFATLVPLVSTSDHNGWVVVPDIFAAYGWAAAIFPIAHIQWYIDGTIRKSGLDVATMFVSFVISTVAVYAGFILQSKEVISLILYLFGTQAIVAIIAPKVPGKLWVSGTEMTLEPKLLSLTRTNGFILLSMELQFFLVLIKEMDHNEALGYATLPVIPYMLSTLFITKDKTEAGLQKFGHIIGLCFAIVCIASLLLDGNA